jgi:hypothetical protein
MHLAGCLRGIDEKATSDDKTDFLVMLYLGTTRIECQDWLRDAGRGVESWVTTGVTGRGLLGSWDRVGTVSSREDAWMRRL